MEIKVEKFKKRSEQPKNCKVTLNVWDETRWEDHKQC